MQSPKDSDGGVLGSIVGNEFWVLTLIQLVKFPLNFFFICWAFQIEVAAKKNSTLKTFFIEIKL